MLKSNNFARTIDACRASLEDVASYLKRRDISAVCRHERMSRRAFGGLRASSPEERHGGTEVMADTAAGIVEAVRDFIAAQGGRLSIEQGCELEAIIDNVNSSLLLLYDNVSSADGTDGCDVLEMTELECDFVDYVARQQFFRVYDGETAVREADMFYLDMLQRLSVFMKAVRRSAALYMKQRDNVTRIQ